MLLILYIHCISSSHYLEGRKVLLFKKKKENYVDGKYITVHIGKLFTKNVLGFRYRVHQTS